MSILNITSGSIQSRLIFLLVMLLLDLIFSSFVELTLNNGLGK